MEGQSKGLYDLLDKQNFMKKQNTNKLYIGDTVTNRLNISDNFKDKSTKITSTPSPSKSSENDLAKKSDRPPTSPTYDTICSAGFNLHSLVFSLDSRVKVKRP